MVFRDRAEAGRRLAERLLHLKGAEPVVLALPRGGVPVALPIAEALGAPLDLLLVRKIGAPWQPELALGAVVEGDPPQTVVNDDIVGEFGVRPGFVAREAARQIDEIGRRRRLWLHGRPAVPPGGRTAVVVDDGLATGSTARAACAVLRAAGAGRVVLAVPVAPAGTGVEDADELVVVRSPEPFAAVGRWYDDFTATSEQEVVDLLRRCAGAAGRRSSPPSAGAAARRD